MSEVRRVRLKAALILGLFATAVVAIWWLNSPEIRFVLPADFRGGFIIIEDPNGTDLGWRFARRYVVNVPPSRVVKVKSHFPFQRMHTESIQLGSDRSVSRVNLDPSGDTVELRCMGSGQRGEHGIEYRERMWYVFGTAAEATAFDPLPLFPES